MIDNVVSFLAGVAIGVLGKYGADALTDKRRAREEKRNARNAFENIRANMPKLIGEMKSDLLEHPTWREFFVLRSRGIPINRPGPRFMYYEDEHEDLLASLATLQNLVYVEDITDGNTPMYRMKEEFARDILDS